MRPRPDAAENIGDDPLIEGAEYASMRPRPDAAENFSGIILPPKTAARFNEAAARCRGKLLQWQKAELRAHVLQ